VGSADSRLTLAEHSAVREVLHTSLDIAKL
jgi:hypothetical protein